MTNNFTVRMSHGVLALFFLAVGLVAAATAWSFRAGFTWTGICLIVVAAPLALFYWYMLYVNPSRANIHAGPDELIIQAPPFLEATLPYATITRAFMTDLTREDTLQSKEDKRIMRFFGYVSGSYITTRGKHAIILTNVKQVLCLDNEETLFLLGADELERLVAILSAHGVNVVDR